MIVILFSHLLYVYDFVFVWKSDYEINTDDLRNFTVFIKTIVAFTQYNIKLFVYFIRMFLSRNSFFLIILLGELWKIIQTFRVTLIVILIGIVLSFLLDTFCKIFTTKIRKLISQLFIIKSNLSSSLFFVWPVSFYRVVLLKFNRIGNVILILPTKKKNAFLLSSLIYYKVEAMNYPQASTIGETNTKVFCHILYSICFSIDLLINIISMEDSIEH